MTVFVAFLRGVNLGKRTVKSAELKKAFEDMGLAGARTLLASGNVIFEAAGEKGLAKRIEAGLEERFGFKIGVVLRMRDALEKLVATDPFAGARENAATKLYVTLLGAPEARTLPMPCRVEGDFEVVKVTDSEVFIIAHRLPSGRFGAAMEQVWKHFGKQTLWTSRNWNTVVKAAAG